MALLKTLEEPPAHAILLLTAGESGAVLDTLVSRCQLLAMRALPASHASDVLERTFGVDKEEAALLGRISGGRLGWATSALEDPTILEHRTAQLEALAALLIAGIGARFKAAESLARDADSLPMLIENLDLLVARSSATTV